MGALTRPSILGLACCLGLVVLACGKLSPTLPKEMQGHTFAFVIGAHHSGTTITDLLLGEHEEASRLTNTHAKEDEGQHVQSVYLPAYKMGGLLQFAFNKQAYMDETHEYATDENRIKLFNEWGRYWNTSKRVLVEKSPRHVNMMRFLQAMFGEDTSQFIIVMRHPFGTWNWMRHKMESMIRATCASTFVLQWLKIHDIIRDELPFMKNVRIFQFEDLLGNGEERTLDLVTRMYEFFGLKNNVPIELDTLGSEIKLIERYERLRKQSPKLFDAQGRFIGSKPFLPKLYKPKNTMQESHLLGEGVQGGKSGSWSTSSASGSEKETPDARLARLNTEHVDISQTDEKRILHLQLKLQEAVHAKNHALVRELEEKLSALQTLVGVPDDASTIDLEEENSEGDDDDAAGEIVSNNEASSSSSSRKNGGSRRSLNEFWGGSRDHVVLHAGTVLEWVPDWLELIDVDSPRCQKFLKLAEPRLNEYGYSIQNLTDIRPPPAFKDYML
eukprot:m.48771 g.48771  ORF g.48771 m.48771 type:complete len:500 (-) comp11059_c0_seq1:309-1808(-)